jgi:glutathione S-transferase
MSGGLSRLRYLLGQARLPALHAVTSRITPGANGAPSLTNALAKSGRGVSMSIPGTTLESHMKLYYMTGACSLASLVALHESGIKFETAALDRKTRKTSDGEDYNQVNSKGYVPALRLDDGQVLTENVAVLLYIADRNPATKLAPAAGTLERYRLIEWLAFINSEIHKNYAPLFHPDVGEETKQFTRANLSKRLDWLNAALGANVFLTRDTFTVADAYLFVVLGWSAHAGIDIAKWPNLKRYRTELASRPAVRAALKGEGLSK